MRYFCWVNWLTSMACSWTLCYHIDIAILCFKSFTIFIILSTKSKYGKWFPSKALPMVNSYRFTRTLCHLNCPHLVKLSLFKCLSKLKSVTQRGVVHKNARYGRWMICMIFMVSTNWFDNVNGLCVAFLHFNKDTLEINIYISWIMDI